MRVRVVLVVDNLIVAESIGLIRESLEHVLKSAGKQTDLIIDKTVRQLEAGPGSMVRGHIDIQRVD